MTTTRRATNIITALLLFTVLMVPSMMLVYAQASITVSTDKSSYVPNQTLTISGTVSPVVAGQDVAIIVYGPTGELKAVDQATPSASGTYSKVVMTFVSDSPSGTWSVKATYQASSSITTFTFTGVTPKTNIILTVEAKSGALYAGGDKADIYFLTSYMGKSIDSNVTATLYGPNAATATITVTKVSTGLYVGSYTFPAAAAGTYTMVANASISTSTYLGYGLGLVSIEVSSKLNDIASGLAALQQGLSNVNTGLQSVNSALTTANNGISDLKSGQTDIQSGIANINTGISDLKKNFPITVDVSPIWYAVVLSLIAAIAAIYSTITVQRKIAG
jgi:hypothetical protein